MKTKTRQLGKPEPTLPSHYYFDEIHYKLELDRIWYQHWLCIERSENIADPGQYRVIEVGNQNVIVTRDEQGQLRAFHNTCRHRGSILCEHNAGHFRNGRIVCPYHSWTYSLSGKLKATPWRVENLCFDPSEYSLYEVSVGQWAGLIFINLDPESRPFDPVEVLGEIPGRFENWNLGEAVVAHTTTTQLACNWKVFWENFSECYHCPGVHPELCDIIPIYGQGITSSNMATNLDGKKSLLADHAVTWSVGGKTSLPWFEGLSREQQEIGQTLGVFHPSCYLYAHVDYARLVQMLPRGPEQTELRVSWLFPEKTIDHPNFSLEKAIEFGATVVQQDARVCELNQRGLRSNRHKSGILVSQEISVHDFHQWVRSFLCE